MQEEFKIGSRIEWAIDGEFEAYRGSSNKQFYDTGEIVELLGHDFVSVRWDGDTGRGATSSSCNVHNIRKLPQAETSTENTSLKAHKHKDLIIAWANGEEIECFDPNFKIWETVPSPGWQPDGQYRIKPKKKEPVVRTMFVEVNPSLDYAYNEHNLRLTFDAESHKLISAEVLN